LETEARPDFGLRDGRAGHATDGVGEGCSYQAQYVAEVVTNGRLRKWGSG